MSWPGADGTPTAGRDSGTAEQRNEGLPEQQPADFRPGRWLPRHQPWNAPASIGRTGRSIDELSARLDELDELRRAGLLTEEEFARQRARLLRT